MAAEMHHEELRQAVLLLFVISGIPIIAAACVGFIGSFFQTVLQVQEQSIGYCLKFFAAAAVIFLCGGHFTQALLSFVTDVLLRLAVIR